MRKIASATLNSYLNLNSKVDEKAQLTLLPHTKGVDYTGRDGSSVKMKDDGAVKIKVSANVMEIVNIDQVHETFTAVFTITIHVSVQRARAHASCT